MRTSTNTFPDREIDALSFAAVSEALRCLLVSFFDDLVFFAESPPESGVPGPLPLGSYAGIMLLSPQNPVALMWSRDR